jgi:hypothetical protein
MYGRITRLGLRFLSAGIDVVETGFELDNVEKEVLQGWLASFQALDSHLQKGVTQFLTTSIIDDLRKLKKEGESAVKDLKIVLCEEESPQNRQTALKGVLDTKLRIIRLSDRMNQHWREVIEAAPVNGPKLWAQCHLASSGDSMKVSDLLAFHSMYEWSGTVSDGSISESLKTAAGFPRWTEMPFKAPENVSTINNLSRKFGEQYSVWSEAGYPNQKSFEDGTWATSDCITQ